MEFTEPDEHVMLRRRPPTSRRFGHEYFPRGHGVEDRRAVAGRGRPGFLGVHLPEEHGGGGGGMTELAIVSEELAADGCPLLLMLVSAGISAELVSRFGDRRAARAVAARARHRREDGVRHHRARRRVEHPPSSPPRRATATATGCRGTKYYISGVDEADAILVVARTGVDEDTGRASAVAVRRPHRRARASTRRRSDRRSGARDAVPRCSSTTSVVPADRSSAEGDGLRQVFVGLNPERICGAALNTGIGRYALDRAAAYANEREVWGVPIGATRASPTRWPRRRSTRARPAHDCRRRPGCTTTGTPMPPKPPTWRSSPPPRPSLHAPRPGHPDPRRQRHGHRVRARRPVGLTAPAAQRAGEPRDDPQLRRPAVLGLPEVLLTY